MTEDYRTEDLLKSVKRALFDPLPFKKGLGWYTSRRFIHKPFFVVGSGRSGTTVLGSSLNCHPSVVFQKNEVPLCAHIGTIGYHYHQGYRFNYVYRRGTRLPITLLHKRLADLSFEAVWGENYGIAELLKYKASRLIFRNIVYWGAKSFPNEQDAMGLRWIFPDVKFIYIYRNGIEVVHSMTRRKGFRDKDYEVLCHKWVSEIAKYAYLTKLDCAITIRHENLLANPEEEYDRIFTFLGISYSAECINYAKSTIVHPLDQETRRGNARSVLSKRRNAYQTWSERQRIAFKAICAPTMNQLGYELPF